MTLEWPKNVIEKMTEVLLSLLYYLNVGLGMIYKHGHLAMY